MGSGIEAMARTRWTSPTSSSTIQTCGRAGVQVRVDEDLTRSAQVPIDLCVAQARVRNLLALQLSALISHRQITCL